MFSFCLLMFPQHSSIMFRLKLFMHGCRSFFRGKGDPKDEIVYAREGGEGSKDEFVFKGYRSEDNYPEFTMY